MRARHNRTPRAVNEARGKYVIGALRTAVAAVSSKVDDIDRHHRRGDTVTDTSVDGGCLCGAVRYRLVGAPQFSALCHCRSCRRASGAPAVSWLHVALSQLSFTKGAAASIASSPGVERTFCARCGTPLTYRAESYGDAIDITTCSLDDPDLFPVQAHVWASHRLGWFDTTDHLPRFPTLP